MPTKRTRMLAAIYIAAMMFVAAPAGYGDELPEGITVTVIAEYESRVPSLDKVRLVRVLMEPGASFVDVVVKSEEYCELKAGTLTHVNHTTGATNVFTPGARWAPGKGNRHTHTSTGDEVVDMWVYQLIEEGEDADSM